MNNKKIIYFGSSVPKAAISEKVRHRKLIGSPATRQREQYILSLLQRIGECTFQRYFVTTAYGKSKDPFLTSNIVWSGVNITLLGYVGSKYLRHMSSYLLSMLWIWNNYRKNDIAITYNFPIHFAFPLLLRKIISRSKLIIEFEDFFSKSDFRYYLNYPFEVLGIYFADAFIASSYPIAEKIKKKRKNAKIVVHSGYVLRKSAICGQREREITNILYSGTLDRERGVDRLIDTFRSQDNADFNLILTGDGVLKDFVKKNAREDSRILFYDNLPDDKFMDVLSQADICVCPQLTEVETNFPSKVTAYLSLGKPVLSTRLTPLLKSDFSGLLTYYDERVAQSFWDALMSNEYDTTSTTRYAICRQFNDIMQAQDQSLIDFLSRLAGKR